MAANFPGSNKALPGAYSDVQTLSRGVSVPGGTRLAALIGEGLRVERLVNSAVGGGRDGVNSSYSSSTGADGRHFSLSLSPVVSNRTVLYKNGVPLTGLEQAFSSSSGSFSSKYDYRININNGRIELQSASLVDQGGSDYKASSTNVGNGTIDGLTLEDVNAPTETWTVRCSSVRRDGSGNPVDGYAKFIAQGSVSGVLLDGYGNVVTWQSNGTTASNSILSFSITEGATPFQEGDRFTIKVKSGALNRGDSLVAHYIAETDLNDPEFFADLDNLTEKHGAPSLTNLLSLGGQLAFANGPPGVFALQAAPAVPRRVSYTLEASASGSAAVDDLQFALPLGVVPDTDSKINFFVTDPTTGEETQILPNKVDFYDATLTSSPSTFHFGSEYVYSYTVILEDSVQKEGDDGVLTALSSTTATISSSTVTFGKDDEGATRSLKILSPATNAGTYTIVSVSNGVATISRSSGTFTNETSLEFQVTDSSEESAKILFTDDLALTAGHSLRATVVDTKDASFFDAGWTAAYEALERIECDIVVPLPSQTISAIFQQGRVHCEKMSNIKNRKERVLFIGAIAGLEPEHVIGTEPAAVEDLGVLEGIQGDDVNEILAGDTEDLTDYSVPNSFGNTFRVTFFYPDEIIVQVGADRATVDGFFIAAAAAGYCSRELNVYVPLTRKQLAGFTIPRSKLYRPEVLEDLAAAGVCVLQPAIGGGTIMWGKTTTQSGEPTEEEMSVVFIRDRMSKDLRKGFERFAGTAEDKTTHGSMLVQADKLFQGFMSRKLITRYKDVKVVQDPVEPRQWNVSGRAQPTNAINWVYIKVDVGQI